MSIRLTIALLLTLVALATSVTLYKVTLSHRPTAETAANARIKETAVNITRVLEADLSQRYANVQAFAQNRAAAAPAPSRKGTQVNPLVGVMNRYMATYQGYALSMLVAPDGRVLAVNTRDHDGKEIDTQAFYSENFAEALWFKDAKEGKYLEAEGRTGTTVIGPYNDKNLATITGDDGLALAFSTQVTNEAGQLTGIWVNFVPFGEIEQIIATSYDALKEDGLGRTAITLLDNKGVVLVDYDPSLQGSYKRNYAVIGKLNMLDAGVESVNKAINGKDSGVVAVSRPVTRPQLVDAYSYDNGTNGYPGLGWTVLVRANGDELYSTSSAIERDLYQTAFILVAAVLLFGLIFLPKLSRTSAQAKAVPAAMTEAPAKQKPQKEAKEKKRSRNSSLADTLAPEMQATVKEVADAATAIRHEMERLSSAAAETKRRAGNITSSLSHAAMAAGQVDIAVTEISEAAETIDRHLEMPSIVAEQADIKVDAIAESLNNLAEASQRMEDVIPFITNLANQINLLALNATIEAARAGDAGTGFSVIANELKTLATQAATATSDMSQQLETAREISQGTVDSVREAMNVVEEVGTNAARVSAAIEQQRNAASKVSRNVANTESGLRDITEVVGSVEEGADETANAVKQLQATAVTLHRQIAILNEKVEGWVDTLNAA